MDKQVPCTFVSVWDGGFEVKSDALLDVDTSIVSDIQTSNLPEGILNYLEILDREYIRVGERRYDVRRNEDDTYSAIRTFEVFFSRNGYAEVQAASAEEARRIADEEMKYDDVSWDDDWHPTDVQLEE